MTSPRRSVALAAAGVFTLLLAGCTLETTGAVKGDDRFFARFDDVQELVVGHTVRISDVNIGTVLGIELDGYDAVVEFTVENGRDIPEGTTASVSVTSLLGENYIALQLPDDAATAAPLPSGATLASGGSAATIEELAVELLALTRAIQGRDIAGVVEAGAVAVGPRGDELGQLIDTLGSVTNGFAAQSATIDALLTDLDVLLSTLAPDAGTIGQTIDLAADATGALATQRDRIVTVVEDLTTLAVALDAEVLAPHRQRLTNVIADLTPVVGVIADERETLIKTVEQLVVVTERLPIAMDQGAVNAYAWITDVFVDDQELAAPAGLESSLRSVLLGEGP